MTSFGHVAARRSICACNIALKASSNAIPGRVVVQINSVQSILVSTFDFNVSPVCKEKDEKRDTAVYDGESDWAGSALGDEDVVEFVGRAL